MDDHQEPNYSSHLNTSKQNLRIASLFNTDDTMKKLWLTK